MKMNGKPKPRPGTASMLPPRAEAETLELEAEAHVGLKAPGVGVRHLCRSDLAEAR